MPSKKPISLVRSWRRLRKLDPENRDVKLKVKTKRQSKGVGLVIDFEEIVKPEPKQ